jgi:hypothetical protein
VAGIEATASVVEEIEYQRVQYSQAIAAERAILSAGLPRGWPNKFFQSVNHLTMPDRSLNYLASVWGRLAA